MTDATPPTATVAILSYNGEKYLRQILLSLRKQQGVDSFEVLVIDSGSTDTTLAILQDFPEVRVHQIPQSEFGHGSTRNLAAQLAHGKFVAYLTHDAIPNGQRWLIELLSPFDIDERVVAVVGKQVPRPDCFPVLKYDISRVFSGLGSEHGVTLFHRGESTPGTAAYDAITFYSDVNSAARRDFLVEVIPYRDVSYAEDQFFGRDLIDAGYWKAYAPLATVEHSNDMNYREYGKRVFTETMALINVGTQIPMLSLPELLRRVLLGSLGDAALIVRDNSLGFWRKIYWLALNPFYQLQKWQNFRRASSNPHPAPAKQNQIAN